MPQVIEIEGESVRVVTREVSYSASLADVLPLLVRPPEFSMFIPRTAIFYSDRPTDQNGREVAFLCELPPSIRYIVKSNRRYRLSMPWTYFWFSYINNHEGNLNNSDGTLWQMGDHRVYHAQERVTNGDSILYPAFLPNVYEDGRICFGTTGVPVHLSVADKVDALVNEWYSTQFNNDVHSGRSHPLPFDAILPYGWRQWVEATREHGLSAYLKFPEWDRNNTTAPWTTVSQIIGTRRIDPITVEGEIPPLAIPPTFGRATEWLTDLPDNRARLRVIEAANALRTEHPELFVLTEAEAAILNAPIADDGGEPMP